MMWRAVSEASSADLLVGSDSRRCGEAGSTGLRTLPRLDQSLRTHGPARPDTLLQREDASSAFLTSKKTAPQTSTEKIVQRHAVGLPEGKLVQSGDYVTLAPHYCMTHDKSWPIILRYMSMGATQVHNPQQAVMALDHDVQNTSESNLKKYRQIEPFAK